MKRFGILLLVLAVFIVTGSPANAASSKVGVDVEFLPFCEVVGPVPSLDLGTVDFSTLEGESYYANDYEYFTWKTNTRIIIDSISSGGFRLVGKNGLGIGCDPLDQRVKLKFDIPQWNGGWEQKRVSFSSAKFAYGQDHKIDFPYSDSQGGYVKLGIAAEIEVDKEDAHLIPAGQWRNEITITFAAPHVSEQSGG